jgi:hypothetical protein
MAFADPQTILTQSLARTGSGLDSGVFTKDDGTRKLEISHFKGKRTRRVMKFTDTKNASDPLNPTLNKPYSMSATLTVDVPPNGTGYTVAEAKVIVDGLVAYLTASSGARVTQLLGGES